MIKKILGLDLGISSIGWALVEEDSENPKNNAIIKLGVRVNSFIDEKDDFAKGKSVSINAARTFARGARRRLQRFKLRRTNLIDILKKGKILKEGDLLTEVGKNSTFQTQKLRAKAVKEKIELVDFARVLFLINKKRGYKSNRKAKGTEDGESIDAMFIAKKLFDDRLTPGEYSYQLLKEGKKQIPDFYRSDLQAEFDSIWNFQKRFNPEVFTENLYKQLQGKSKKDTRLILKHPFSLIGINQTGTAAERKMERYLWRSEAVKKQLDFENLAIVFQEINGNLNNSSNYLGAISDRSKELYFNNQTIGEYLYAQLEKNPHARLKDQVFYRQDYLDEFEKIWKTQSEYHKKELTDELKKEIRDVVIFYQRKLKSQKGLISICEFEWRKIEITKNEKVRKKIVGLRVAPKSSPLFQEFKIWQRLNDLEFKNVETKEIFPLDLEHKEIISRELNIKGDLSSKDVMDLLGYSSKEWKCNFNKIDGNKTNETLYNAYLKILVSEGAEFPKDFRLKADGEIKVSKIPVSGEKIKEFVKKEFVRLGIETSILDFNAELEGNSFEKQASYQLWHLLYSYEGDNSRSGNKKLYELLGKKFGFKEEHSKILANIGFSQDYGSLSTKAMRKIYPQMKQNNFSTACERVGYKHSKNSLTKEENKERPLKNKLELLKKNSLRQPTVEMILNQMVNLVNELIDENSKKDQDGNIVEYFRFDEIRVELARELKKSIREREDLHKAINSSNIRNKKIGELLQAEFGIKNPTRNDIIRYRLYQELKNNGYKDLYTNTYIPQEKLFSKEIDIDHIIPQSKLFDDSFSNKTLTYGTINRDKGNRTGFDYIESKCGTKGVESYIARIENLFKSGTKNKEEGISKAKYHKLLKKESEIEEGFIERDLSESQYIAKKAKNMLLEITRSVVATSGSITARLREDWDLVNVMKELNLPKYRALGLTEMQKRKYKQKVEIIKDWTKRNDHRHHAMDALTIAFTRHSHIQYLNYLNAREDKEHKEHKIITAIEGKETEFKRDESGNRKRVFKSPIPDFRKEAKKHLEEILISHKAKNKAVTKNKNKISGKEKIQEVLTPRGQLHKDTIYGKYHFYKSKKEKISAKFDEETIQKVSNPLYRSLLLERLKEFGNDPKKAFTKKNAMSKNPIYLDKEKAKVLPEKIKLVWLEEDYSIRKEVNPENFNNEKLIDKILDERVKKILKTRLKEFDNDAKKAFSNLDKHPIWFNKEKGISIKRVTISGVKNAEPLHYKKDHFGKEILDENGNRILVDFVSTGNNHHVAIYQDEKGNLQEKVVSLFDAIKLANAREPIIDETYNQGFGWKLLFTMKQNEMFVFPNNTTGFNPEEIDLLDPNNKKIISPNLFRVQKIASKNYFFRHHLETTVEEKEELKDIAYKRISSTNSIRGIVKVRINHLGDIVSVGEFRRLYRS